MLQKTNIINLFMVFLTLGLLLSTNIYSQEGNPKALEVLETLQERYVESIEGIDDFIMIEDERTTYHKKAYDNGRPYFKTRIETEDMEGVESTTTVLEADFYSQVYEAIKDKVIYEGTDDVDGHNVHVLYIEKLENFLDDPNITDETIEDIRLFIDPDKWVIRQMQYTVEYTTDDGEVREVSPVIHASDFRNVEGMMIAYETKTIVEGIAITEEERREAEEGLDEYEKRLAEMPEAQREMVEGIMGDQIAEFKQMLEEDKYETVRRVKEVKVNTGMEDF